MRDSLAARALPTNPLPMSTRKSRKTGRPRGRPRKETAPPPLTPDVESLINSATAKPSSNGAGTMDSLARELEHEERTDAPALTGTVHDAPEADPLATPRGQQQSQQVGIIAVLMFGVVAMWRGEEWVLTEEQAKLIGDATVLSNPEKLEELLRQASWAMPAAITLGMIVQKASAEIRRRRGAAAYNAPAPGPDDRMPGTAPAS